MATDKQKERPLFTVHDYSEFIELAKDPAWTHYIGRLLPFNLGVRECFVTLEFTCYDPRDEEKNAKFLYRILNLGGAIFAVASIPTEDAHLMEQVADGVGMRFSRDVPVVLSISDDIPEVSIFPVNNERIFSILLKRDHPYQRPSVSESIR
ncbi:MAG: hypothetical protein O2794_03865 [bacterium]|nr:hypothetical protein [bacterium]